MIFSSIRHPSGSMESTDFFPRASMGNTFWSCVSITLFDLTSTVQKRAFPRKTRARFGPVVRLAQWDGRETAEVHIRVGRDSSCLSPVRPRRSGVRRIVERASSITCRGPRLKEGAATSLPPAATSDHCQTRCAGGTKTVLAVHDHIVAIALRVLLASTGAPV
jgi:hypothetical protein